jgi:PKD repeat protein
MSITTRLSFAAVLLTATACTVKSTPAPAMTGPSELALRVAMQITPDSILQDGASQAVLQIEAASPDGRPVRGLSLRVATVFEGVVQDFGTLSTKTVVTGDDGRARVTYTSPPRPAEPSEQGNIVTFAVEPIGNDYAGEVKRTVDLRLVTPGVLLPPNTAPVPDFTLSPSSPLPLMDIVFDASTSQDEGLSCGAACAYRWEFGDGVSATGVFVKHQYQKGGTYQVRLTVTDARGASTTIARPISVGEAEKPTASFTNSPTTPVAGQTIFFNAEESKPAAGRRIVSYAWDFGSGRTGSGVTTSKSYDSSGTYTVTLTVTDDAGATGTVSRTVTVNQTGATELTAVLSVSPESTLGAPLPLSTVFVFDAGGSDGPSRIVEYRFNFSDGTPEIVKSSAAVEHTFTARGSYVVSVTVRDAAGRTARAQATAYVN